MQANSFLIINGAVVLLLILRIFGGRKPDRPTPLQIHDTQKLAKPGQPRRASSAPSQERLLNFPFQYGQKQYDLFFVLNVPNGAPREVCVMALDALRAKRGSDPLFMSAIENAILKAFPIS